MLSGGNCKDKAGSPAPPGTATPAAATNEGPVAKRRTCHCYCWSSGGTWAGWLGARRAFRCGCARQREDRVGRRRRAGARCWRLAAGGESGGMLRLATRVLHVWRCAWQDGGGDTVCVCVYVCACMCVCTHVCERECVCIAQPDTMERRMSNCVCLGRPILDVTCVTFECVCVLVEG